MTRRPFAIAMLLLALLTALPAVARAELKVVATVPTLAAIAKEVGGSKATVRSLALPTQDPHFVDAKPSLALELNQADLLVTVGLGLEVGWLPALQLGARNPAIQTGAKGYLDCSQGVTLLERPEVVDRSQGDIHPGGNPHYLYDPRSVVRVAKAMADRMGELDPPNRAFYQAKLKRFTSNVEAEAATLKARMAAHAGAAIIGYHKSWAYLADWLGLRQVEFVEPKPGIPPNPAHVAKVLATARAEQVKILVQESFYPDATTRLLADKSGARLVRVPGGVDFAGGEPYLDHLDEIVSLIEKGLGR